MRKQRPTDRCEISPLGLWQRGGLVAGVVMMLLCPLSAQAAAPASEAAAAPTVGMEGRVEVALPGTLLEARPVEPKAKLVLRIAAVHPRGESNVYDLRYLGLVPGEYDLRNFLVRRDGSPTNDLPLIPVRVAGVLPADHDGQLVEPPASVFARLGGYRNLMILTVTVWVGALVPWILWRQKKPPPPPLPAPEPTLADRLRPLVEQAAAGTLSRDGQAQLERMLLNYWRQHLQWEELPMAEAVARLRAHPEAGALLRDLESWLHRPPGTARVDVQAALAPYRNLPGAETRREVLK